MKIFDNLLGSGSGWEFSSKSSNLARLVTSYALMFETRFVWQFVKSSLSSIFSGQVHVKSILFWSNWQPCAQLKPNQNWNKTNIHNWNGHNYLSECIEQASTNLAISIVFTGIWYSLFRYPFLDDKYSDTVFNRLSGVKTLSAFSSQLTR